MRFSARHRFSLARAAGLAAALACSSATSFGGNLYTENFNSYSGFQNTNQVTTVLPVAHTGTVTGWNRSGAGTIHAVRVATGDWAPMFYEGSNAAGNNIITTASTIALTNTANQTYRVTFQVAPGVYANINEATGSTDGVVLALLTGANATITSGTFLPGAFSGQASSGNLPFQNAAFDYVGTGSDSGALRLQFAANNAGQSRFGGTVDNVNIVTTALWNNGTSGNWSTAGNWRSGAIPVNSDLVLINGTSGGTSTNDISNLTIAGLEFMSGAGSFTVSGNDLTLSDGVTNAGNSSQTLATNLILGGATRVFRTVGNLTVSGVISNGSGSAGLTKNGTGTLTLSGANTYTGVTTVNAGTLALGANQTLGEIAGAGNLSLSNYYLTTNSSSSTTYSGVISGTGGLTKNGTGTLTIGHAANTYNGSTTINGGTLLVTGNISSSAITLNSGATIAAGTAATVSKVNAAALTVAGNTGYIFTIGNISGGTVGTAGTDYDQIATTGAITFNNTAANSFTVYINGTPTNWSSSGNYTWNILSGASLSGFSSGNFIADISAFGGSLASGASWTFGTSGGNLTLTYGTSGTPTWAGGTGVWSGNFTPGLNNNSGLFFSGAGGNAINDIGNGTLSSIGTITFDSAAGAYTLAANSGSAGNGTALSLAGSIINNSNSTQTINTALSVAATRTINTAGGNVTTGGAISGAGGLTKTGNSTLTLSGANTYTGVTTVNAGTLALGANQTLGAIAGAGNLSLSNYYLTTNSSSSTTYTGVISGTGGLTKNGTGTLTLSNTNTYTGNTTINAGTVVLNSTGNASTALIRGNVTVNTGATLVTSGDYTGFGWVTGPTSLNINGGTVNIGNGENFGHVWNTLTGGINFTGGTLQSNNGTSTRTGWQLEWEAPIVNTNASANTATIAGRINLRGLATPNVIFTVADGAAATDLLVSAAMTQFAGWAAGFTKNGTGTMALTGNNTYTGATTINAGTLEIGATGLLGAGSYAGAITNNATLIYSGTNDQTLSGVISGTGALTQNAASTLTLSGNNTYNGTTTINTGTLLISTTGLLGGGNYSANISNTGTLLIASNSNQTLGGVISGSGALTKNGTGTLTLTGNNSYSGATTINSGTLVVNGSAANSAVTIGNATILAGTGTVGGVTVQSGGRLSPGNNAVGNLNASTLTFNGGGGYNWEISNVSGTAGTNWDMITVGGGSGAVTINANAGNKFTIYLSGNPTGWDTNAAYEWNIIDWGTVTGFDANAFTVDTTGFTGTAPVGTWTFSNTGGYLNLAYAAGDPAWSGTTGNWSTAFSPSLNAGNKTLTFSGAAGGTATNDIPSATVGSVAGITFNSTAGAYTLAAASGSAGYDTGSALQLNGNIVNNSTATQTINTALTSTATRVYDAAAGNLTMGGVISGTGGLTKNGSNLLTLSANNTYTGDTTINAGTVQITTTGLLGGGNYSGNITNNGALLLASNSNQTLSGVISGTGALTKNGTGTLTLTGSNNYSGGTTLNAGTLVIGNTAAAGSGSINQTSSGSLLKVDVTGTINNAMSYYTMQASRNATLAGAQTVNNASFNVDDNTTLTITGNIGGTGGVTKNGNGTLTLNGTNTYNGSTIVNSGTLEAASAGALGSNNTVHVNGGTLLVSEDDAINGMNITLNGTSTEVATLSFNHDYNGTIGTLTLSANSIIDMGNYNIGADFADLVMGLTNQYTLKIYNWSGATRWGGGTGADQDRISFGGGLSDSELGRISFYSDFGSGFLGTGFELGNNQIIPVPEPETWATGILLVLGGAVWIWRKRRNFSTQSDFEGDVPSAPIEKMVGLFRRNDPNEGQSRPRALPANTTTI